MPIDYRGFEIEHALRGRLRPRLRRALPQPPLHRRAGRRGLGRAAVPLPLVKGPTNDAIPPHGQRSRGHRTLLARPSQVDGWLYTSGQVGLDPATGELVDGRLRGPGPAGVRRTSAQVLAARRLHVRRHREGHGLRDRLRRLPRSSTRSTPRPWATTARPAPRCRWRRSPRARWWRSTWSPAAEVTRTVRRARLHVPAHPARRSTRSGSSRSPRRSAPG